jgi:hypothetical protein
MAITVPQHGTTERPVWPKLDADALNSVRVDYDPRIDYLYIHLHGEPLSAVWDPRPDGDTWVGLRLVGEDDWADEVVAIMVAHFRRHAVRMHPKWEDVLSSKGAERAESLRAMIADVAGMPNDNDSGVDEVAQ